MRTEKLITFKRVLVIGLSLVMVALLFTGCNKKSNNGGKGGKDSTKVLRIYAWNDQFKQRFEDLYTAKLPKGVEVEWIITPTDNNAYQNKLDADLPDNAKSKNPIDIFMLEADYILKYVDSEVSLDLKGELGITDADLQEQYDYTKEIATTSDGKLKASSWEADPGVFVYRRSIAKDVLGTDDPAVVQEALADWTKFAAVAEQASAKGYKMLSGFDDSYRTFSNNIANPWVNSKSEIVLDPQIETWVQQTKEFTEKGYNNKTTLWSTEWNADQGPSGKVFGFFYSTWGVNFTLLGNALANPDGAKEVGNGAYGDYAVCYGPASYYWGGTWIACANGSDNKELVADVIKVMTCNGDSMKKLTEDFEDFCNNKKAMEEISAAGYKSAFLGGQNHLELFLKVAPGISMKNVGPYDQAMTETFQQAMLDYFNGKVDYNKALDNFYNSVLEKHPNLKKSA